MRPPWSWILSADVFESFGLARALDAGARPAYWLTVTRMGGLDGRAPALRAPSRRWRSRRVHQVARPRVGTHPDQGSWTSTRSSPTLRLRRGCATRLWPAAISRCSSTLRGNGAPSSSPPAAPPPLATGCRTACTCSRGAAGASHRSDSRSSWRRGAPERSSWPSWAGRARPHPGPGRSSHQGFDQGASEGRGGAGHSGQGRGGPGPVAPWRGGAPDHRAPPAARGRGGLLPGRSRGRRGHPPDGCRGHRPIWPGGRAGARRRGRGIPAHRREKSPGAFHRVFDGKAIRWPCAARGSTASRVLREHGCISGGPLRQPRPKSTTPPPHDADGPNVPTARPGSLHIDWTAWDDVGMAVRGGMRQLARDPGGGGLSCPPTRERRCS